MKKVILLLPLLITVSHAATVIASDDSFIQLGNAGTNYGSDDALLVKDSDGGNTTRKTYLLFDLSSITSSLATASLDLTVLLNNSGSGATTTPSVKTMDVFTADTLPHFGENTLTWNNAPNNNTSNGFSNTTNLVNNQSIPAILTGNTVSFSNQAILDYLNDEIANGDSMALFLLRRDGDNSGHNLSFYSKDNAGVDGTTIIAPTLNYTLVPEPSAALLSALGALALLRRKR